MSVIQKLFNLSGEICIFDDKSARRMGYMTQSMILPVTSPMFTNLKNSFTSKVNDKFVVK